MTFGNVFLLLVFLAPVVYYLVTDYNKGLCLASAFLVSLTVHLDIKTPGAFPNFTVHRLIVIALFVAWFFGRKAVRKVWATPLTLPLAFFALAGFISLVGCVNLTMGLKRFSEYVFQILLFYIIVATSLKDSSEAFRLLRYVLVALTAVAFLGVLERYTGLNPVDRFVTGYDRGTDYAGDVLSTYPHRILLGAAMAMGFPLAVGLSSYSRGRLSERVAYWMSIVLLAGVCYLSLSRGPWLAFGLAVLLLFGLGSVRIRKVVAIVAVLAALTLAVRPGILGTLQAMADQTTRADTPRGSSYMYRWELWRLAYSEVSKSAGRMLFGYGPGSTSGLSFDWVMSFSGRPYEIWSWDNHYACYLMQLGFVGLLSVVVLYVAVLRKLLHAWRRSGQPHRDILAGVIVAAVVLMFMKTNVFIFAPQLEYAFWAVVPAGVVLGRDFEEADYSEPMPEPSAERV